MNLLENWKNLIEKARKLDRKSLEAIRFAFFGAIVVDLFGIYWYLKLKSLGSALLIVLIIGLTLVLLLERGLPPLPPKPKKKIKKEVKKMTEETKEQETQEVEQETEQEEPQESLIGDLDTGLPDAEEYKKRAEKALGSLDDFS